MLPGLFFAYYKSLSRFDVALARCTVPQWSGSDFDSVYVLDLDDSGALVQFTISAQQHAPKSTTCPPNYVPPEPWMPHDAAPTHGFEDI